MSAIRCPETSVTNYQSMLRNVSEEQRFFNKIALTLERVITLWRSRKHS